MHTVRWLHSYQGHGHYDVATQRSGRPKSENVICLSKPLSLATLSRVLLKLLGCRTATRLVVYIPIKANGQAILMGYDQRRRVVATIALWVHQLRQKVQQ